MDWSYRSGGDNGKSNSKDNRRSFDCGGESAAFAQDDNFGGGVGRE